MDLKECNKPVCEDDVVLIWTVTYFDHRHCHSIFFLPFPTFDLIFRQTDLLFI